MYTRCISLLLRLGESKVTVELVTRLKHCLYRACSVVEINYFTEVYGVYIDVNTINFSKIIYLRYTTGSIPTMFKSCYKLNSHFRQDGTYIEVIREDGNQSWCCAQEGASLLFGTRNKFPLSSAFLSLWSCFTYRSWLRSVPLPFSHRPMIRRSSDVN